MNQHGLVPPYLEKISKADFEFKSDGYNSLAMIHSGKLSVAECSTIIFDSWHLNIPAFTFSGKNYEQYFNVDYSVNYLGKYNIFVSIQKAI